MEFKFIFLLQVILGNLPQNSFGAFPEAPMNTTCTLGQSFFIRCRTPPDAVSARWVFNGERLRITHPPDGLTPTSFNDLFKMEMTCVVGRHYNTIQCVAILDIFTREEEPSPPATIKVQGMPDRVQNVRNTSYPSVIIVTWDSLGPSVTYCITVTNVTDQSLVANEICVLNETSFMFKRFDDEPRDNEGMLYEFAVISVNSVGRGPSSSYQTNFRFDLPDIVQNMRNTSTYSVITVTWDSLGPDITYCINISGQALAENEICGLNETSFEFGRPDSGVLDVYEFVVMGVNSVGRGLPSDIFQTMFSSDDPSEEVSSTDVSSTEGSLPSNNTNSTQESTTPNASSAQSSNQMKTVLVSLVSSIAVLVLLVLCVALVLSIYKCYHFIYKIRRQKDIGIEMLRCDAYQSVEVQLDGSLKDFGMAKYSNKENCMYESIVSIPVEPMYASVQ